MSQEYREVSGSVLVTDRLKLTSDEKSTVHGKEFHTFTTLSTKRSRLCVQCGETRPAGRAVPSARVARACLSSKKLELYFWTRLPYPINSTIWLLHLPRSTCRCRHHRLHLRGSLLWLEWQLIAYIQLSADSTFSSITLQTGTSVGG